MKLKIGISCSAATRALYFEEDDLARLAETGELFFREYDVEGEMWGDTKTDSIVEEDLAEFASDLDLLIVCHGSPRVTRKVFETAKNLRFVGELEGDRFAGRIDVVAANEFGVLVVDTTHSSSWPVSEWALALSLIGLREHARFRDIIAGKAMSHHDYRTKPPARELTGKTVGIIGFGHIGWRLREFLVPFRTNVLAYDPYAPRELAEALDVDFAPLEKIMACDVVICLAPETAKTRRMIGKKELDLMQSGGVFVNVSRGSVVEVTALVAKAAQNDAWFCLDAHNPEPIAVDSPLRKMRNVFLSPHIGGMTEEAQPRFFTLMVEEIERFHQGHEPRAQITERVISGRSGE
jgi:phosphoglycerate dehydrogenase-like enzyme